MPNGPQLRATETSCTRSGEFADAAGPFVWSLRTVQEHVQLTASGMGAGRREALCSSCRTEPDHGLCFGPTPDSLGMCLTRAQFSH